MSTALVPLFEQTALRSPRAQHAWLPRGSLSNTAARGSVDPGLINQSHY